MSDDSLDNLSRILRNASLDPRSFFGDDIEGTYRKIAIRLHPDKNGYDSQADRLFKMLGKLKEDAIKPIEVIESPDRQYEILSQLGHGDLCDVYLVGSGVNLYVAKVPFVEAKSANNLLAKEREILESLSEQAKDTSYRHYFPQPVESFTLGKKRVNVTKWRDGCYTSHEIREARGPLHGRHIAWMFRRLLTAIGYIHRCEWTHNAITPQHAMFSVEDHGLHLCGWIHAMKPNKQIRIVPAAYRSWYPSDTKMSGQDVDMYLAAKTAEYLAGGLDMMSAPMAAFMRGLLLPSRSMRPHDAWAVADEFKVLLEDLYGPPKFVSLEM